LANLRQHNQIPERVNLPEPFEEAQQKLTNGRLAGGHAKHGRSCLPANLQASRESNEDAADLVNVSSRSVARASQIP